MTDARRRPARSGVGSAAVRSASSCVGTSSKPSSSSVGSSRSDGSAGPSQSSPWCLWSSWRASAGWARMPMALERRTSIGSVSPCRARMSAIRSTVALSQMASPAVARAMISFKPCRILRPSRTNRSRAAAAACCSAPTGSASIDGRLQQCLHPAPRHRTERGSNPGVDRCGLFER